MDIFRISSVRFLCFSLSRSASNSTRSNHLGNPDRSINTDSFFIPFFLDRLWSRRCFYPRRPPRTRNFRSWNEITNDPNKCTKMCNARGFKMSSKKRRIGWRKRRNRPIPSNSNSCSIDVLLLSAISRRVSAHNLRPMDIRSAARRVHRWESF